MEFPQQEVLVKTRGRRAFRLYKIVAWKDRMFAHRLLEAPPAVFPLKLPEEEVDAVDVIAGGLASKMSLGLALKGGSETGEEADAGTAVDESDAADAQLDVELVRAEERIRPATGRRG